MIGSKDMKVYTKILMATTSVILLLIILVIGIPQWLLGTNNLNDLSPVIPRFAVKNALRVFVSTPHSIDEKIECLRSLDNSYNKLEYFQPYIGQLIRSDYSLSVYACALFHDRHLLLTEDDIAVMTRLSKDESVEHIFRKVAKSILEQQGAGGVEVRVQI